ncbi:ubiquinol-cytochrome c reductase cytochrome b subunit [Neoasaia chiangmaiensis NBRC 101099]|uniref:Cytochrome b n=1 Tax=Neoasaia chiangmaiensis TaxID=320497 RepID=A0A1U9KM55_9PROT|nr:cytochrome b N-terminal domain-containing protein [Neoasaia chiangmaiensis]AQS86872.1 ubiquinol-cytochrome C reductase [Neoasaia chiangmaiensis]GBR37441.1 ubiquinol-cytochrome c reductase cytochrome b subunit [Neoasaia chiangmaiensis NBRC 101099]GEN14954.1 cytochrome b [Neoasaia chiangmaiensis]
MSNRSQTGWLASRFPIAASFRRQYLDFAMPRNLNYLWNFGAFLTIALVFLVVSGIFLAINYTPTITSAFSSVEKIDRAIASGWFIRSLHIGGVSMLFAALYIHIARSLYYGSYKAPRELVWITGLCLLILVMLAAFAGYILPWGQMSFWGATVVINALKALPLVGTPLSNWLLGDSSLGDVALHRFFILHFVTAFAIIGIVTLHVATLHVVGPNNPAGIEPRRPEATLPFHPYYTTKDGLGLCLFLMIYAGLIFFLPDILTLASNYVEANPLVTPRDIMPEWYFSPFYAILRAVPSKLGGLLLASGSVLLLFFTPWLDRSPIRSARHRPRMRWALRGAFLAFILLGLAGSRPLTEGWLWISRAATIYWYAYFLLVLPLLPRIENPNAMSSIQDTHCL